jgi:hypothetical protein
MVFFVARFDIFNLLYRSVYRVSLLFDFVLWDNVAANTQCFTPTIQGQFCWDMISWFDAEFYLFFAAVIAAGLGGGSVVYGGCCGG